MRDGPSRLRGWFFAMAAILALSPPATIRAQYVVRDENDLLHARPPEPGQEHLLDPTASSLNPGCWALPRTQHGEQVPGAGRLLLYRGLAVNDSGQIAFMSAIQGSARNQGIFLKDNTGLHAVAIGCGGFFGSGDPAGCGDPTPIGGTFSAFLPSFPPAINDAGDVLFIADVHGGSSPRGLFLYRRQTRGMVKVAAIGDPSPVGSLVALGVGSLNNRGEVVFLGGSGGANEAMAVLHWRDGVLSAVVKPGDPVPGGVVYSHVWIGTFEQDGTYFPLIANPDINDAGDVSYMAILQNQDAGLYVWRRGVNELYVLTGQPSPVGGAYFWFHSPILNEAGEIAFQGEYEIDPWTVGWFVGRPGKWRHVISFYDRILDGRAWGLAVSHNPQQPLDDEGNLVVWADIQRDDGTSFDTVNIGYADGTLETIAKTGDPSPLGGTLGRMGAWPVIGSRRSAISAFFGQGGVGSMAHLQALMKPADVTQLSMAGPDSTGSVPLTWSPMAGAGDGSLVYDVLRGRLADLMEPSTCAVDDHSTTSWPEPWSGCNAGPGDGCWYLVRAQDGCGVGPAGSKGIDCADPCNGGLIAGCSHCGNKKLEADEICDGSDLGGRTCESLGYDEGALRCGDDCTLDSSGCAYVCGNKVLGGHEQCDGLDLAGETCESLGYDQGTLGCLGDCTFDYSGCSNICGNGVRRGSEQCDGTDLRGYRCHFLGFDRGELACGPDCTFDTSGCCCSDGTPGCQPCPVCGNGVREAPYELCDGADTGSETCRSQGRLPGELGCNSTCDEYDYSGCVGF